MADTYSIYFGTVSGSLSLFQSGILATQIAVPVQLDYATTYYWRVDATNENGTTTGDEWSFTTLAFDPPSSGGGGGAGSNNMATVHRLAACAKNTFWYEDI